MKKQLINILFIGGSTVVAGIINYLYHPVILKFLDIKEFAEIESLLSLFNVVNVIFMAISLFLVKEIIKNHDKTNAILDFSFKYLSYIGIGTYLIFLICTPFIAHFLKIDNFSIFAILGLSIILSFAGLYQGALFQAIGNFRTLSLSNIGYAILRFICSIGLVIIGFGLYGAVVGLVIGQCILFIILFVMIKKKKQSLGNKQMHEQEIITDLKKQKEQIIHYFIGAVIIAFFMNFDILLAKHFFDITTAGIYAGISVIGKLVLFIVFSIETVYYPDFIQQTIIDKTKIAKLSLLYILVILGSIGVFSIFGTEILYLFKPGFENYLRCVYLIFVYAGIVGFMSLIIKVLIAFKKYIINYMLMIAIVLCIISFYIVKPQSIDYFIYLIIINIFISLSISLGSLYLAKKE